MGRQHTSTLPDTVESDPFWLPNPFLASALCMSGPGHERRLSGAMRMTAYLSEADLRGVKTDVGPAPQANILQAFAQARIDLTVAKRPCTSHLLSRHQANPGAEAPADLEGESIGKTATPPDQSTGRPTSDSICWYSGRSRIGQKAVFILSPIRRSSCRFRLMRSHGIASRHLPTIA